MNILCNNIIFNEIKQKSKPNLVENNIVNVNLDKGKNI